MVSLTGFAPVISCMRGRRVGWTTPQGQMVRAVTHPHWLTELCPRNGGSEACCPLYLSHESSAIPFIRRTVLFELHADGGMPWTCTTSSERRTHSLAPKPGSLVRWIFQIGSRDRTCTCNLSALSGTPLLWATRGEILAASLDPDKSSRTQSVKANSR